MNKRDVCFLILMGGQSRRMDGRVKSFVEIRGKKLFDYQLEWLKKAGVKEEDLYISYGHRQEIFDYLKSRFPVSNLFSDPDGKKLGDAGAIRRMLELRKPKDGLFVMNGDLFTAFSLQEFLNFCFYIKRKEEACFSEGKKVYGVIVTKRFKSHLGILELKKSSLKMCRKPFYFITSFREKPVFNHLFSSCGIYFLYPVSYDTIEGFDFARDYLSKNYLEFIVYLINDNEWFAVETLKDVDYLNEYLTKRNHEKKFKRKNSS